MLAHTSVSSSGTLFCLFLVDFVVSWSLKAKSSLGSQTLKLRVCHQTQKKRMMGPEEDIEMLESRDRKEGGAHIFNCQSFY